MNKLAKISLTALALTFTGAPAFAADMFVVQDSVTKKCSVVEAKPTATTVAIIADKAGYKTRAEADTAMGKHDDCSKAK